jgi:DtxR family Mn-dependent transcriptional regulator
MRGRNIKKVREKTVLSASLEDYLEAILNVADAAGTAHSKDIAENLGVAKPSVTGALRILAKKGLVNYKPYGCVTLTAAGADLAAKVAKKHDIIKSFFTDILGVNGPAAQKAACKAEHLLGPAIVSKMSDLTDFAKKRGNAGDNLKDVLQKFVREGRTGR